MNATGYMVLQNDAKGMYYEMGDYKHYCKIGEEIRISMTVLSDGKITFSKKAEDLWYSYIALQWATIVEIEALRVLSDTEYNARANDIKILRIVPFTEFTEIVIKEILEKTKGNDSSISSKCIEESPGTIGSTCVYDSKGVTKSKTVYKSTGVQQSKSVMTSQGVFDSEAVVKSSNIARSRGVYLSTNVTKGFGVYDVDRTSYCAGVYQSSKVYRSYGIGYSSGVAHSRSITDSHFVHRCSGVHNCMFVSNCNGISNRIFDTGVQEPYRIFGTIVSESRFLEVEENIIKLLAKSNISYDTLSASTTFTHESYEVSTDEFKSMFPKELVEYLISLPEFDYEIFYKITGIKLKQVSIFKIKDNE